MCVYVKFFVHHFLFIFAMLQFHVKHTKYRNTMYIIQTDFHIGLNVSI